MAEDKGKPRRKRGLRYWLRLLLFFIATCYLALILSIPAFAAIAEIRPAQAAVCCETPADRGLDYEAVSITTRDGIVLRGWFIPSRNGAVVIALHGYGGNRLGVLDQAEILAKHDFGVLLYDERASGESGGETLTWGWRDVPDVSDAIDYLQTRSELDPERIGVYGCSTGAEIALASAGLDERLRAVVADGAGYTSARDIPPGLPLWDRTLWWPFYPLFIQFMEWRSGASPSIDLVDAVPRISPRPLLLISTGQTYEFWQNEHYYELAGEPAEHWNLPDALHCQGISAQPEEYERRMLSIFDTLLEP